ncbi:MAG: 1,4-dihydroxy-6-naphthoate synthase [Bacteroidetes bacterium GWC2_33_15]|nr:MAG: 1,4-dihydroxy-6-naphthoate synthase [Bacteroidetes bacterium GWA2_33_15]OFX49197.1 MAG: 1,4-dihydroxy-6-naphthoate synthase [Bacteroidetes bacterium GWC2_33_15]OFX64666.1 MAG: 1,4-dihydroxy-6-naphthoate synthase [Bacteroidetes bacterium GWB2_32_14]OFX69126.1 MAG: 1,4-dihydroxy-6-naphthoate synthase [Bacteroidetes bacterium GWD2_33_33]HAN17634.1 1,4-dihydroxy-6-naphthoate synthase [Bacteroidales bacterium]
MQKVSLGFSSCPNDTFIFNAMVHHKIDTEGLAFDVFIADVEELNKKAFNQELDVSKISFHAFAHIARNYFLLDSGSALGKNNGPLLISKKKIYPDEINDLKIAIPGKNTTANLLFSIAFPDAKNKTDYLFSDIEDAVISNEVDAGLIIHENRFTYEKKGLKKIIDLGEFWEAETGLPIPLGGIAIKRDLNRDLQLKINRIVRKSVEYAFMNPKSAYSYIKKHAQEMSEDVMYKHIELYVNNFSIDLGNDGKNAIRVLYKKANSLGIIPELNERIFLT